MNKEEAHKIMNDAIKKVRKGGWKIGFTMNLIEVIKEGEKTTKDK